MMKIKCHILLFISLLALTSCITSKDVKYFQPSESLVINEEGLIPYNIPTYRITKNDILKLNIVTTPLGSAAQFYSGYNTDNGEGGGLGPTSGGGGNSAQGGTSRSDREFYFKGLKVNSQGEVNILGIGFVKVEGRTIEDVSEEIQQRVNENFVEGKSQVRLDIDGITYYILGDIESTGLTGQKVAHKNSLNLTEALAMNGGLGRSVDRTNIRIHRKYPEGIKIAQIDLTREDAMNSPYYWIQNGDEIFLTTRKKSLNGFGKDPLQTITTGVSAVTTLLSIYLILTRL